MTKYYFYIDFLKTVAVLLIINSHMDPIYPYKFLATGGALGNALFFAASGFLMSGKEKNGMFWKKFSMRIYIPLILVNLIYAYNPDKGLIEQFIWPTNFWFIGAIVLFYILFYAFEKMNLFIHYKMIFFFLAFIYVVVYVFLLDTDNWVIETPGLYNVESCFKLIYYFGIMIMGGVIRKKEFTYKEQQLSIVGWMVSLILLYMSKYFIVAHKEFMCLQFLNQLFTFSFATSFFIWATKINGEWEMRGRKHINKIIKNISAISLELYLVQFPIILVCGKSLFFPISAIAAVVAIVIAAKTLRIISGFIMKYA